VAVRPSLRRPAARWFGRRGPVTSWSIIADEASRWQCRHLLRTLKISTTEPLTVEGLTAAVAARTGRPIHVMPLPATVPGGLCGLWVNTADIDYIYVDSTAPPVLRRHTAFHELGHILLDHHGASSPTVVAAEFDALDPDMVRRVLGRMGFDDTEERAAEIFADVAGERAEQNHYRAIAHRRQPR